LKDDEMADAHIHTGASQDR
jgi:hypothetical protein